MKLHVFALMMSFSGASVAVQVRSKTELHTSEFDGMRSQSADSGSPNILWIMADDLHYETNVMTSMPNLGKLWNEGLQFPNHVSQSPLCGPSRASLLVGRLPHNAGYKRNAELKSIEAFLKLHDNTVGKWLTDAGYYTAFLGKYVNAILRHEENLPTGWRYFGAFTEIWDFWKKNNDLGGAYTYYNTSQFDLSYDEQGKWIKNNDWPINVWTDVHQADFLATQTLEHALKSRKMGKPFFIFTNPTMVHHGPCHIGADDDLEDPWNEDSTLGTISPCAKKEHTPTYLRSVVGDFLLHAKTSAWNQTALGQKNPPHFQPSYCFKFEQERMAIGRRNRTASLLDLDEMVGAILRGLKHMNFLDNTYVFFTSDNGFHLGEHGFWYGKELPYDHDVRVPFVVRTPAGKRGVRNLPSSHIDITATIVDLANAANHVSSPLDGKSFAAALTDEVSVMNWRQYSFSEMFEDRGKTWRNIRHINDEGVADWSMNFWCNGDIEVFRIAASDIFGDADANQLINCLDPAAGSQLNEWAQSITQKWLPLITGMGTCSGSVCNSFDSLASANAIGGGDLSNILKCEADTSIAQYGLDAPFGWPQHGEGYD